MRRLIATLMSLALAISLCSCSGGETSPRHDGEEYEENVASTLTDASDGQTLDYVENSLYVAIADQLPEEEFEIKSVEATFVSKEYYEELSYNSQENVYFGHTLSELDEQFQGTRYVFTVGDDGETTVRGFEAYDDTYDVALQNVAVGAGVILVCVVVEVATGGTATPVIGAFAISASDVAACAAISAGIGAAVGGVSKAVETGDPDQALKAAVSAGAEEFKWGAILAAALPGAGKLFSSTRLASKLGAVTRIKTINQNLAGKVSETGVKFVERTVQDNTGKLVRGVFPKFKSVFDAKLPANLYSKSDFLQFKECNKQLLRQIERSPRLKEKFAQEQLDQIADGVISGAAPDGFVWHHNEKTGVMQLVDSATHSNTRHTGGRSIWGGGTANR